MSDHGPCNCEQSIELTEMLKELRDEVQKEFSFDRVLEDKGADLMGAMAKTGRVLGKWEKKMDKPSTKTFAIGGYSELYNDGGKELTKDDVDKMCSTPTEFLVGGPFEAKKASSIVDFRECAECAAKAAAILTLSNDAMDVQIRDAERKLDDALVTRNRTEATLKVARAECEGVVKDLQRAREDMKAHMKCADCGADSFEKPLHCMGDEPNRPKFQPEWTDQLRILSAKLRHIAPNVIGTDQGHVEMLAEVADFLDDGSLTKTPAERTLDKFSGAMTDAVNANEAQQMANELEKYLFRTTMGTRTYGDVLDGAVNILKKWGYGK